MKVHRYLAVLLLTSFALIWYYIVRVNNGYFIGLGLGSNSSLVGYGIGRKRLVSCDKMFDFMVIFVVCVFQPSSAVGQWE